MGFDRVALSKPIRPDAPSGDWLRRGGVYSDVREAMRSEAGDRAYGIQEKRPDWAMVDRLCQEALTNRTKDLYLAICLLEAGAALRGVQGLADGLWLLAELHKVFWDDLHPRPRDGGDLSGRLNQIETLRRFFSRIVDAVSLTDGPERMTWFDWRHLGARLPNGEPSPWTSERRRQAILSTPWQALDSAVRNAADALAQISRLDEEIDRCYGSKAPSLADARGTLEELARACSVALEERGPSPQTETARDILDSAGCTFLDVDWLAEHVRRGVPTSRALSSIQAAVADSRRGTLPAAGWPETLEAAWVADHSYEATAPEPAPPAELRHSPSPPGSDPVDAPPIPRKAVPSGSASIRAISAPASTPSPNSLLEVCRHLRAHHPEEPMAYLVPRFARWRELAGRESGALPAPPPGTRERLNSLFARACWEELAEESEELLLTAVGPYWLDLQRFTCAALGQIGGARGDIRSEILSLLAEHLRVHPDAVDAVLGDGEPAADETTRQWIRSDVREAGAAAPVATPQSSDAPGNGCLDAALERLETDGLEAAVDFLRSKESNARSGRARALVALDLGELCLRAGRPDLAAPVLEGVRRELCRAELAKWESEELVARSLSSLYRAYTRLASEDPGGAASGRLRELAEEISRIDLGLRLRLEASQT